MTKRKHAKREAKRLKHELEESLSKGTTTGPSASTSTASSNAEDDIFDKLPKIHGKITTPDLPLILNKKEAKQHAASIFDCSAYHCRLFSEFDALNEGVIIEGYKCMKETGKMGGSLYIDCVNGKPVKPQLIYGVPKLEYPYTKHSTKEEKKGKKEKMKQIKKELSPKHRQFEAQDNEETEEEGGSRKNKKKALKSEEEEEEEEARKLKYSTRFPNSVQSYFLSNKWNGVNIQFFKYLDENGSMRVSAKTKGSATLHDATYGDFLTLTCKALGLPLDKEHCQCVPKKHAIKYPNHYPAILKEMLEDEEVQSMSFELCGHQEPHLVKYDFGIALKPLFKIMNNGIIKPLFSGKSSTQLEKISENIDLSSPSLHNDLGPFPFTSPEELISTCEAMQARDFEMNELFRKRHNLKLKYEYQHFIREGYVLYLLTQDGFAVPHRTLYKIKPKDIEEVHWGKFDEQKQLQVREAMKKLLQKGTEFSEKTIQEELDMGEKEWDRFGSDVMNYIRKNQLHKTLKPAKHEPITYEV